MEFMPTGKPLFTKADLERYDREMGMQQHPNRALRIMLNEVTLGLFDTTPEPRGKAKQFWVMRLRQLPGRNQLPRGFSKKPLFV